MQKPARYGSSRWTLPEVEALGFLPDGRIIAASNDGVVVVLNQRGDEQTRWTFRNTSLRRLAVSPDGRRVLIGGVATGPVVLVVDTRDGTFTVVKGHQGDAGPCVAWHPSGESFATGDDEGMVRLWNARTLKRMRNQSFAPITIVGLAYSNDGDLLVVAPGLRVCALGTSSQTEPRTFESGPVRACEPMTLGGSLLFTDGWESATGTMRTDVDQRNGFIRVWDLATSALIRTLPAPADWTRNETGSVQQFRALQAVGGGLLAGCSDGTLRWWANPNTDEVVTLTGHQAEVTGLAVWKGTHAASCCQDGSIRLWSLETLRELSKVELAGPVDALGFGPNGQLITAHGSFGPHRVTRCALAMWSGESPRIIHRDSATGSMRVSANGSVTLPRSDGVLHIDAAGRHTGLASKIPVRAAASTREHVMGLTEEGLSIWRPGSSVPVTVPTDESWAVASAAEADRFVTRTYRRQMTLWQGNGKVIKAWKDVPGEPRQLAISPSGAQVATAQGGQLFVWETSRSSPVLKLRVGKGAITAVAFESADQVVVVCDDNVLTRCDLTSRKLQRLELGDEALPVSLAVNERQLAVGRADGTILVLPAGRGSATLKSRPPHATPSLGFALEPDFADLVGGALEAGDFDDSVSFELTFAKPVTATARRKLLDLYDGWGRRVARATYASQGFRSEAAAARAGHPLVRRWGLTVRGNSASGSVSRFLEITPATRWLIAQLRTLDGLVKVKLDRKP